MSGGVAESVGPEVLDTSARCSTSKRAAQSFWAELLTAAARPQVRGGGVRMLFTFIEVAQERLGRGTADRDDPAASAPLPRRIVITRAMRSTSSSWRLTSSPERIAVSNMRWLTTSSRR